MQISGVQSLCNSLLSSPLCCEHPVSRPPQTFGSIPSPPGVTLLHLRNCQGSMLGQTPFISHLSGVITFCCLVLCVLGAMASHILSILRLIQVVGRI